MDAVLAVIAEKDIDQLKEEGYVLIHRPNICMEGYTRKMWTVDEEKKVIIDAAAV